MSDNQNYAYYRKVAWAIYSLMAIIVIAVLVLFIARDYEEMFFYSLMTVAGSYVFRPTDRALNKYILKYTGVSPPTENE